MLGKRTPGAPLSDAERQQRRDAAKARWAAVGAGAAVGAVAGAALSEGLARERRARWIKGAERSKQRWGKIGEAARAEAAAADAEHTRATAEVQQLRRRGKVSPEDAGRARRAKARFERAGALVETAERRLDPRPMVQWSAEEALDVDRGRPARMQARGERIQILTPKGLRQAFRRSRLKYLPVKRLGRAGAIGAGVGVLAGLGGAWALGKRTPGAPLSEAEIEQRRNAARARWAEGAAAAAVGAAAGAGIEGARQVVSRAVTTMRAERALQQGKAAARAATVDAERKVALVDRVAAAMRAKASSSWPTGAYAQHLGNVVRRREAEERLMDAGRGLTSAFDHPQEITEGYRQHFAGETGELRELRGQVKGARRPKKQLVSGYQAENKKAEVKQSVRSLRDPLKDPATKARFDALLTEAVAAGEDPARAERELRRSKAFRIRRKKETRTRQQVVGKKRQATGAYRRTVAGSWPRAKDIERWRPEMLQDIARRAGALRARVDAEGWAAARAARHGGMAAARRILAARPRLSGRTVALAALAGAAVGGGAVLAREKLGKAATVSAAAAETGTPTPAQAKAGNYRKGRVTLHGLPIVIETPKGAWRRGIGANGKAWAVRMPGHYGYVGRTKGADGDQVDVMLGPDAENESLPVWVIDQINPGTGAFDEHKAYLGWPTRAAAIAAYDASFSDGSGPRRRKGITRLTLRDFAAWAASEPDEPLAKVSPDDGAFGREIEPDDEVPASTTETARRLAETFRVWMLEPNKALEGAGIAEALRPLRERFVRAGVQLMRPPPLPGEPGGGEGRRFLAVDLSSRSPRVEHFARTYELDRIRAITEEARAAIRQAIVTGAERGLPIPEQARLVREAIGLSPGQARWVQNYRAELEAGDFAKAQARALRDARHDRVLQRHAESQEPLSAEQIDKMVASYQRRVLAYRATTIARTEGLRAANHGQIAGTRVFLEDNPGLTVIKTWIATADDRTRDAHRDLDREEVEGIDTPFIWKDPATGRQAEIRWPHDPQAPADQVINCRCSIGFRVVPKSSYGRLIATPMETPRP